MPGVWVFPGGAVDPADGESETGYKACAVRELAEEAGIGLAERARSWCCSRRWITPEVVSRRFDAWFFLALAPAHTPPRPDGVETTDAGWFEPRAALDANTAGRAGPRLPDRQAARIAAPLPQLRLRRLRPTATARSKPILPKVIGTGPRPQRRPSGRPRLSHELLRLAPGYGADPRRGKGSSPACQGPG